MAKMKNKNCVNCFELQQIIEEKAALTEKYEDIKEYAANGMELILNDVYVSFNLKKQLYKFRMLKQYKIVDNIRKFYMIRLHRNKTPGKDDNIGATGISEDDIWNQVTVKLTVKRNNDVRVYCYPAVNNNNNLKVETREKTLNSHILKVYYKEDDFTPIDYSEGDIFEIDYSFEISPKYWGNYIERTISYSREETNIYFQKLRNKYHPVEKDIRRLFSLDFEDENNSGKDLPKAQHEIIDNDGWYKYNFATKRGTLGLESKKLKYTKIRIVWDCEKIFHVAEFNTVDPNTLGMASNRPSSD